MQCLFLCVCILYTVAVQATPPNTTTPTASPTLNPTMAPTTCAPNTGNLTEIPLSYMQLTTIGGCDECTMSESDFIVTYWDNDCWVDDWKYNNCPEWDAWSVFVHGGLFRVIDDSRSNFVVEVEPTTSRLDISICNSLSWNIGIIKALPVGNHCTSFLYYSDATATCSSLRIDCATPSTLFNVTTWGSCSNDDTGLSGGELIGIIVGAVLGTLIIAMTLVLMCCGTKSGYARV